MRGPHSSQEEVSLPDFIRDTAKMRLYYYIGLRKQGKSTDGILHLERMLASSGSYLHHPHLWGMLKAQTA